MRKSVFLVLFLLSLALWSLNSRTQSYPPTRVPQVETILAEVSIENIQHIIAGLVGFGTRHTLSATDDPKRGIGAARIWIKRELEKYSKESGGRLKVEFDTFIIDPKDLESRYRSRVPKPTEIVNVVATLPGSNPESAGRILVVGGHYDSMCNQLLDATCDAPGADDDGSGTAVTMELARVLGRYHFEATLVFVCFAGEEQGLIGATHMARMAKEKNWNITAVLNNDIVGNIRGGDGQTNNQLVRVFSEAPSSTETEAQRRQRQSIGGENDSPSRQLARYIHETTSRYLPEFQAMMVFRRDRYGRGGDHIPFNENGFAAVRFSEYQEDFRHQHQKVRLEGSVQYGDLPEFVSVDYIAQVARVNAATMASLALAPDTPKDVHFGSLRQGYDTAIRWTANRENDMAGYEVLWRETTSAVWNHSLFVGNLTEFVLKGLSKDNFIFAVRAVDRDGNRSLMALPTPASPPARSGTAQPPPEE